LIVILEQAFFAPRRICASRAKRRLPCDAIIARLARFLTKLHHYNYKLPLTNPASLRII